MVAQISESYESREFTVSLDAGRELIFNITGTDDETAVQALLAAEAPASYAGLAIESTSASPLGGGVWRGSVKYKRIAGTDDYTFSTGGGTLKVTQSMGTVSYPLPGGVAPDFAGAIGISGDSVEGVDVVVPNYEFSETHYFPDSFVTLSYKMTLFNLTSRINSATFKGFASGECQFMGAEGGHKGDDSWQITFKFSCSPNTDSLYVGPIGPITKKGKDYVWILYADKEDTSAYALVKRPKAAYVERVFEFGDFSLLGIGV